MKQQDGVWPAPTRTSPRSEVKIPLPATLLPEVEAWIRIHPAQWRVAYPPRQVNNVYLDSPDYAGLNANLGGTSDRAKLRLRWYGPDATRVRCAHLELKRKQGAAGWKEILDLDGSFDLQTASWSEIRRHLQELGGPWVETWLARSPVPMLINHYRRRYYTTPDDLLRLTLDSDLYAYGQRSIRPNLSRRCIGDEVVVVELKAALDPATTRRLSKVLSQFPARVDRFSKYVHGVLAASDLW